MLTAIASAALLGASAVIAAPWQGGPPGGPGGYHPSGGPWGSWHHPSGTAPPSSGQTPFTFPLPNGFPNIKNPSPALRKIEEQAHGTLPNGDLPTSLTPTGTTIFELIAFNELFEVAFFTSLINNITNNVPGFEIGSPKIKQVVLDALVAVQGQEELHALGANGILMSAGETPIQPCQYVFPTADFDSAIDVARTFTDLVLGTLQDAITGLAVENDNQEVLVPLIGSVIGQEGEQNGFYRSLLGLIPSELPFLTRSTGAFAFSALNQMFVVPGSCPNSNIIDLPIFGALTVNTMNIQPKDQKLSFTFTNNGTEVDSLSLVYINQQNLPIVEKLENVEVNGDEVTFQAYFPFNKFIMNGLTIAAVTNSAGPFQSATEVADATLFGPGLIEVG